MKKGRVNEKAVRKNATAFKKLLNIFFKLKCSFCLKLA